MNNLKKLLALLVFLSALPAMAEGGASKKKVNLSFDNELVSASLPKPEIELLFKQKDFNYSRMLKFRKDFIPEAERSRELVNGSP